jgi:hypothetical protein
LDLEIRVEVQEVNPKLEKGESRVFKVLPFLFVSFGNHQLLIQANLDALQVKPQFLLSTCFKKLEKEIRLVLPLQIRMQLIYARFQV